MLVGKRQRFLQLDHRLAADFDQSSLWHVQVNDSGQDGAYGNRLHGDGNKLAPPAETEHVADEYCGERGNGGVEADEGCRDVVVFGSPAGVNAAIATLTAIFVG